MYDVVDFPDLIDRYFSSKLWLGAFILSVIYLLFRINKAQKRALIAAIMGFFLIINTLVIQAFTALGENSTFYRHLWAIPSVPIIGIAIIDIFRIMPNWYLKIPVIAVLAVFVCFANQEYIRCRDQYYSMDAKMVTDDTIGISDKLEEIQIESGKQTLFVICPTGYGVQYGDFDSELSLYNGFLDISDSSLLSDQIHNGEEELTGENPDVPYIMSTCCANGMDCVVVANTEGAEEQFKSYGYKSEIRTKFYLLYKCSGYEGFRQDQDKWKLLSNKLYYDQNGDPQLQPNGYCGIRYNYDKNGNRIRDTYYDADGNSILTMYGYATVERKYEGKKLISETYYDTQGNVLGFVGEQKNGKEKNFTFYTSTDGTIIRNNGSIEMHTDIKDNEFNGVFFQIYDILTGECMITLARGYSAGTISNKYVSELKSGKYFIQLKANGTKADEYVRSVEYIGEGAVIQCEYVIDSFDEKAIKLKEVSVTVD